MYWKPGGQQAPNASSNATNKSTNATNKDTNTTTTSTLSKSVMSMKFMKRKLDSNNNNNNDINDNNDNVKRRNINDNNNNNNKTITKITYTNDNSIFSTLPGRRSYGGFNKEVERHYEHIMNERRYEKQVTKAIKNTISDEEMANIMSKSSKKSNQGSRYYK